MNDSLRFHVIDKQYTILKDARGDMHHGYLDNLLGCSSVLLSMLCTPWHLAATLKGECLLDVAAHDTWSQFASKIETQHASATVIYLSRHECEQVPHQMSLPLSGQHRLVWRLNVCCGSSLHVSQRRCSMSVSHSTGLKWWVVTIHSHRPSLSAPIPTAGCMRCSTCSEKMMT